MNWDKRPEELRERVKSLSAKKNPQSLFGKRLSGSDVGTRGHRVDLMTPAF